MYCLASKKNKTSYLSKKKGSRPDSLAIKGKQWNLSTPRLFLPSVCGVLMVTGVMAIWWLFTCLPLVTDMTRFSQLLLDSCPHHTEPILMSSQWIYPRRALWDVPTSAKVGGKMLRPVLSAGKTPLMLCLCLIQGRLFADEYAALSKLFKVAVSLKVERP